MKCVFDVTGMSCAACSARVDKAARAVDGVADVSVNLLKNSMNVEFDEEADSAEVSAAVSAAVAKAGYGATPRIEASAPAGPGSGAAPVGKPARSAAASAADSAASAERQMRARLTVSVIFAVPLFYLAMGPMFGWPLPGFLSGHQALLPYALTQFLLLLPVVKEGPCQIVFKLLHNCTHLTQ